MKIRVLDTIGVAIGALDAEIIGAIRKLTAELGGQPLSTVIGGGKTAPDRTAFFNGALSRYLDFMDSYIAPGETCHPSDNLGAVLAAEEMHNGNGQDFLTALAVAYQVQTRLSDVAPVRDKGFDHTTQGAYAAAAGVAKALDLSVEQTANLEYGILARLEGPGLRLAQRITVAATGVAEDRARSSRQSAPRQGSAPDPGRSGQGCRETVRP